MSAVAAMQESNSHTLAHQIDQFLDNYGDPYGNAQLPGAPWNVGCFVAAYLVFVLKVGPAIMRNRKPLQVEGAMRVYNVLNVLANMVFFTFALAYTNFSLECWSSISFRSKNLSPGVEWLAFSGYTNLKVLDLMDTVFFVLRKKDRQITTLHLVHHSILPFTVYIGLKVAPYTPVVHFAILNTIVHIIMYSYYFLASYGPAMQPYLWWKKYITEIQLIQFVMNLIQASFVLATGDLVGYPKTIMYLQLIENIYFTYAFGKFYVKEYNVSCGKNSSLLFKVCIRFLRLIISVKHCLSTTLTFLNNLTIY